MSLARLVETYTNGLNGKQEHEYHVDGMTVWLTDGSETAQVADNCVIQAVTDYYCGFRCTENGDGPCRHKRARFAALLERQEEPPEEEHWLSPEVLDNLDAWDDYRDERAAAYAVGRGVG